MSVVGFWKGIPGVSLDIRLKKDRAGMRMKHVLDVMHELLTDRDTQRYEVRQAKLIGLLW